MPQVTVGLPLYRAKHIAWLALESLARQYHPGFDWELIIAEEQDELMFGESVVLEYAERLQQAGCCSLRYIPLADWIPLSEKWILLAKESSNDSEVFVIQAADCYSGHNRLKINKNNIIDKDNDWTQYYVHFLYSISAKKALIVDERKIRRPNGVKLGADMATRTHLVRSIPPKKKFSGIDRWLFNGCRARSTRPFRVYYDDTDAWKYSLNVHGLNNISKRDVHFKRPRRPYESSPVRVVDHIPEDIVDMLVSKRGAAKRWRRAPELNRRKRKK